MPLHNYRVIAGRPVIGQHYDALAHSRIARSLPRHGCTAQESGRGPDRWYLDGDTCVGLTCLLGGILICVEILRGIL